MRKARLLHASSVIFASTRYNRIESVDIAIAMEKHIETELNKKEKQ